MNLKKRSKPINLKSKKSAPKEAQGGQGKGLAHKNRLEQLLDDAVLGVKKK